MLQNSCFNSAARSDHKQCSLQLEVECVRRDWRGWSGRYGWRGGWVWLSMAPACVCVLSPRPGRLAWPAVRKLCACNLGRNIALKLGEIGERPVA